LKLLDSSLALVRNKQFQSGSMTKGTVRIILISLTVMTLLLVSVYYLGNQFVRSYAPPNITITKNEIISSGGFMDPVTIEQIKVDSIGKEKRPTKYIIEYVTTCTIQQKEGEPPVALKEIKLKEPGPYSWTAENTHIPIAHPEGLSKRINPSQKLILSTGQDKFDTCPLEFKNDSWYFINFQDPVFIGVYVYIDKTGMIHQYASYSGKAPI